MLRGNEKAVQLSKSYHKLSIEEINKILSKINAPKYSTGTPTELLLYNGVKIPQLKEYSESPYLEIGGHTSNHPRLTNENLEDVKKEVKENKLFLEKALNKTLQFFCIS